MIDWNLAINIFFTGIVGVMVVMLFLQISIQACSAIIRLIEERGNSEKKV